MITDFNGRELNFSAKIKTQAVKYILKLMKENPKYKFQSNIADLLGCKQSNVSRFLGSPRTFSLPMLEMLIKKMPESKEYILGDQDDLSDLNMHDSQSSYNKSPIKQIKEDPQGKEIPVINAEVYASIVSVLSGCITLPPDTFIRIPIFSDGEAAVLVSGHSMKGYINQGDWVIIKRLTDRNSVMYGEAHLIVTRADNLSTVKFLKPAEEEDMITLVPYNIEQFEPQSIYKEDILAIYRVVGSFRRH